MLVPALRGSSLNLVILMQIRVQMVLSLATLVLIGVEEYIHFRWCGHL
jgi:hypothetical protein